MRAAALSREYAAALRCDAGPARHEVASGGLVGIEHEYHVLSNGVRIDFATLIDSLDLGRRFLDPGDANARRLPSGAAVTRDGTEAEIALPPIAVRPGFGVELRRRAAIERRSLEARLELRLGPGFALDGSSTHISVSVPATLRVIDDLARAYACTFVPALMLLLDRRDSYGIYLRPRPGRLEFCGEYALAERLQAAAVFAAGSLRALRAATGDPQQLLPPRLRVGVEACRDRYGHLVHRLAAGGDLYRDGRAAVLALENGGVTSAQQQLEVSWCIARSAWAGLASPSDLAVVDHLIATNAPLPVARSETPDEIEVAGEIPPTAFGGMIGVLHRPGFDMAAVMLTWDAAVLLAERPDGRQRAFASVPRGAMPAFSEAIASGRLDAVITAYLSRRRRGRRLEHRRQLATPGLYDRIGPRRALLAREPPPGRFTTGTAA